MTEPQVGSIQLDRTVNSLIVGTRHRSSASSTPRCWFAVGNFGTISPSTTPPTLPSPKHSRRPCSPATGASHDPPAHAAPSRSSRPIVDVAVAAEIEDLMLALQASSVALLTPPWIPRGSGM